MTFNINLSSIKKSYLWFPRLSGVTIGTSLSESTQDFLKLLLGRRQANLCFHFAGSGENLPDITKSRDASLDIKFLALSSRS